MSESIANLNAATDAALKARATEAAAPAPKATPKATPRSRKPAPKAPAPAPKPAGRKAMTPKERAGKPVTATIAAYVEWLNRTVYGGKMTAREKSVAGISITLYGSYQVSPERRKARGVA